MKKPAFAEDTSMFTEDEATVTHKLFKKGERLYREGSYTLWRDDQNDFYVAYAADDRNSSILDDVRASVRGGKESIADNTVNAKAQVLKIVVTSEAKLEFDIYTQGHGAQEVWLHAPSPHSSARSPRHIVFPEVYFASSQAVWKMRATRRAHFDEVCAPPRLRRTEQSPCALRPHTPRAVVSQHPQILTCTPPRLAQWIKFMSGRKPRKESELKMRNTVHNLHMDL